MKNYLLIGFLAFRCLCPAQKAPYIPAYLTTTTTVDGQQFSWSKTMQSQNFIVIWGDSAGLNPMNSPNPSLQFNPISLLDTLEFIYQQFKNLGFVRDTLGTQLSLYKMPVVMYNTFGPSGAMGWANGGAADGLIGAFWIHPLGVQTGVVIAHEFTHAMQCQNNIDYRASAGLGLSWQNAGIFWETHANFMRNLLYPQNVTTNLMDMYHVETWGSWKNTYENYHLLMAIMEQDSIAIVNQLWRESYSFEYPIQTYKRLLGVAQPQFNDKMFLYARRMATYDFNLRNLGNYFRQNHAANMVNDLQTIQATHTILRQDSLDASHFRVPVEAAPEEYGYNVIPLYPQPDSCAVRIRFKGHTSANSVTGWRYGFVAADGNSVVTRYSPTYRLDDGNIQFSLFPGESQLYFVVMGAPDTITTNNTNDTWFGYPKHYRFPYELVISGAVPEGFQPPADFRSQLKVPYIYNGSLHANGGGWVESTAYVAPSVYVGPYALVLGYSNLTGNVRVEQTAIVENATISGNVKITDNALVRGGILSGNCIVKGQSYTENDTIWDNAVIGMRARVMNYKLHGTIEVGGDVLVYNSSGDCNNGVYYRMTNYYQNNLLECDGRSAAHPANSDVNASITPFNANQITLAGAFTYPVISATSVSVCSGTSATLSAAGATSYSWNAISSASSVVITPTTSSIYSVTASLDGLCPQVKTVTVTVKPLPILSLNVQSTAVCNTITQITLSGTPAGGIYSGNFVTGNSFSPASSGAGTYQVTYMYTNADNCTNTANQSITVSTCVGLASFQSGAYIEVSPVPAQDRLVVSGLDEGKAYRISIISASGQQIFHQISAPGLSQYEINTAVYPRGVYFLSVASDQQQIYRRCIFE